jgi:hypothetical protein
MKTISLLDLPQDEKCVTDCIKYDYIGKEFTVESLMLEIRRRSSMKPLTHLEAMILYDSLKTLNCLLTLIELD